MLTKLEISCSVNKWSEFLHRITHVHYPTIKCVLRYLKGTIDHALLFQPSPSHESIGFLGRDLDERRSKSGHVIFLAGNLISWFSEKYNVVSHSTAETEFKGLVNVMCDVLWESSLQIEFAITISAILIIWCDSTKAFSIVANPVQHAKRKHVSKSRSVLFI